VTETYTLDELNQLTEILRPSGTIAYTYDAAGNRQTTTLGGVTTTATYDDASELRSAGSTGYTYDAAGNRLTAGSSTYAYDRLGRLASATVGGVTTGYALDGDGTRVASTSGGTTTPYLWDTAAPLAELVSTDGAGTANRLQLRRCRQPPDDDRRRRHPHPPVGPYRKTRPGSPGTRPR
jgi:YD repeat-containing protein